jgi:hypothetical protein
MPQPPNRGQGQGRVRDKKKNRGRRLVGTAVGRPGPGRNEVRNRGRDEGIPNPAPRPGQPGGLPRQGPYLRAASRDADLAYGSQIQQAQQGVTNAGTWWDQYKQDLANQQTATATLYSNAVQALNQPVPQSGVATPESQQAADSRGVMQQAFGNLLTTQGAAQQAYLGGQVGVGSAQQLQSRYQAQQGVDRLVAERDMFKLSRRDELRGQAHQRRLENAAFGLDTAKAEQDALDDAVDNRRADRALDQNAQSQRRAQRAKGREVNQYGYSNRDWQAMSVQERRRIIAQSKADGSGKGGNRRFTPTQQASSRKEFRKVFSDIRKNDNGTEKYGSQIRKTLMDAGADSLLVNAAWQLYHRGSVSEGIAKALFRDYGIKVRQGKPRKRPAPYSPPADSPGSDAAQGNSTEGLGASG